MNTRRNPSRTKNPANRLLVATVALVVLLVVLLYTCRQQKVVTGENNRHTAGPPLSGMPIPANPTPGQLIERTGYTLSFSPKHKQAAWVGYWLRGGQLEANHVPRTNQFLTDPQAKPQSADDADYEGSGYDRGHLASAEDMSWSAPTMKESFYYTNISPQVPAFNRGVWRRLEELVRYWSAAYDSVYVVTGPVLTAGLPTIGPHRVSVPEYFYKVVLKITPDGSSGIGFLIRNEASAATLKSFAVPIDSVEHRTGIDFFPQLSPAEAVKIEGAVNPSDWLWTRKRKKSS